MKTPAKNLHVQIKFNETAFEMFIEALARADARANFKRARQEKLNKTPTCQKLNARHDGQVKNA